MGLSSSNRSKALDRKGRKENRHRKGRKEPRLSDLGQRAFVMRLRENPAIQIVRQGSVSSFADERGPAAFRNVRERFHAQKTRQADEWTRPAFPVRVGSD